MSCLVMFYPLCRDFWPHPIMFLVVEPVERGGGNIWSLWHGMSLLHEVSQHCHYPGHISVIEVLTMCNRG